MATRKRAASAADDDERCEGNKKASLEPVRFWSKECPKDVQFLSNFFKDAPFELDGKAWPTTEAYYQASKFVGDSSEWYREAIRKAATAAQAKDLGNIKAGQWAPDEVKTLVTMAKGVHLRIRDDWDQVKEKVMRKAVRAKFLQNPVYRVKLLATGNAPLEEANPFDDYWGTGKNPSGTKGKGGGQNRLGVILMELRSELRAIYDP